MRFQMQDLIGKVGVLGGGGGGGGVGLQHRGDV